MKKSFNLTLSLFIILGQICVTIIFAQERKEILINSSLAIKPIVQFKIAGTQENNYWILDELVKGIPVISPKHLEISLKINQPTSLIYVETESQNGNLHNENNEIETSYYITDRPNFVPNVMDPRWKFGSQRNIVGKKLNSPGHYLWKLYIRLFASTFCSDGIYSDRLIVTVIDSYNMKYKKTIDIQTEIKSSQTPSDSLNSDSDPVTKHENHNIEKINFGFNDNPINVERSQIEKTDFYMAFIPISIYLPQNKVPCRLLIKSRNGNNYFADQFGKLKPTQYLYSDQQTEIADINSELWIDGLMLRSFNLSIKEEGMLHGKLWIRIKEKNHSMFTSTMIFEIIDFKGEHYYQEVRIIVN